MKNYRVFVALSLALALLTTSQSTEASEPKSAVEIQGYSVQNVVRRVSEDLPWSKESLKGARHLIDAERDAIRESLNSLKESGAVKVKVVYSDWSESEINKYLGSNERIRRFSIQGLSDSGVVVDSQGPFPELPREFGAYGVHLNSSGCRLQGWNLFEPASWFTPKCEIVTIKPAQYLRFTLIGIVALSEVGGYYHQKIGELDAIAQARPHCTLETNLLLCSGSIDGSGEKLMIPAVNKAMIGGYTISIEPKSGTFLFRETAPDVTRLARTAKYSSKLSMILFG